MTGSSRKRLWFVCVYFEFMTIDGPDRIFEFLPELFFSHVGLPPSHFSHHSFLDVHWINIQSEEYNSPENPPSYPFPDPPPATSPLPFPSDHHSFIREQEGFPDLFSPLSLSLSLSGGLEGKKKEEEKKEEKKKATQKPPRADMKPSPPFQLPG
jgi:hypothetical protein